MVIISILSVSITIGITMMSIISSTIVLRVRVPLSASGGLLRLLGVLDVASEVFDNTNTNTNTNTTILLLITIMMIILLLIIIIILILYR